MKLSDNNILIYIKNHKSRDKILLICNNCNIEYYRVKKEIQYSLSKNVNKSFCCSECFNKYRSTIETYNCKNCSIEVKRTKKQNNNNIFCSRKCSALYNSPNRILSEETKNKISNSMKNNPSRYQPTLEEIKRGRKSIVQKYSKFICLYCKNEGIDENYNHNRKYHKNCWSKISGGIRKGSSRGKSGWYKNYWCDSSYELAFIIYCIDNNIKVERNLEGFEYNFNNKRKLFYPDFIVDNKYIEIKNYESDLTNAKINTFPYEIEVLYKKEMEFYLSYVINKYGKDFIKLYENKGI